ncbi:MAG TPA: hypothetical protein VKX96_14390 [Chloroflexota bacterium]|nr:hypothetical protein [Chloroflexota bacterium]
MPGGRIVVDNFGVRDSLLNRYQHSVIIGETLVIVEVQTNQARALVALLRQGEDTSPAIFIVRPHRIMSGRATELQRRERLSLDRLRLHAARLADQHTGVLRSRRPQPLWDRLRDCEQTIDAITRDLVQAIELDQTISISAEWLLDNAYVIQRQLAEARRNLSHLPPTLHCLANIRDRLPSRRAARVRPCR